jgi:hypothetical protein
MRITNFKAFMAFMQDLWKVAGYKTVPFSTGRDGVVWFNNWLLGMNCIDLDDIRKTEFMFATPFARFLITARRLCRRYSEMPICMISLRN